MTDAELIELVQTKTPHELTAAEVTELRDRLNGCPDLQRALAEHLEMERYLADVLGGVRISPEQVLARAVRGTAVSGLGRGLRRWVALSLFLGGVLVVGMSWWFVHTGTGEVKPDGTSDNSTVAALPAPTTQRQQAAPVPVSVPRPDPAPAPTEEPPPAVVQPPRNTPPDPYAVVDVAEHGLNEAQLKAWFAPVEGQPHAIRTTPPPKTRGGTVPAPTTELSGLWRLRTPWQAGSALRCLIRTAKTFKLYIWNGTEGVALEQWQRPTKDRTFADMGLVAYRTTRTGKEPRPVSLVLAAADEGEFIRTRTLFVHGYPRLVSTPIDLRHEDGLLTVSCGDVRILSVPLAAAPAEVYFEGETSFQALGFAPSIALPPLPAPRLVILDIEKPAELKWLGDQANLHHQPDGSVELSAEHAAGRITVATTLPRQGVCEAIVQLEDVMPGTGVYLGDEKGQTHYTASFLRDETTGRTVLLDKGATDTASTVRLAPGRGWIPVVGAWSPNQAPTVDQAPAPVWLRLLVACGQLKCWVSSDGVTWARGFEAPASERAAEAWASVGLFVQPGGPRRSIRLRRLTLRELPALNSLAPADLVRRAPLVPHIAATPLSDWLVAVHASRPPEVDPAVWSRACALRALASGVSPLLGRALLETLLDHGVGQPLPFDARLRLIDEALSLVPKSTTPVTQRFLHYYERLGQALHHEGDARPYSRLRQALYHTPLTSSSILDVFPESLAAGELLDLANAGNWEEVEKIARAGRIHRPSPSLFEWAEMLARGQETPKRRRKPIQLSLRWRAGMVLESDKEGSNDLAEIEAACRANSLHEAGRIITRIKSSGLLPDSGDSQRLMAWPIALAGLFQAHSELAALLRTELAPEGQLQLRRALDEKDDQALEALALRYSGTAIAAEALLWLGDRHLLDGDPALAVGRYRQALRQVGQASQPAGDRQATQPAPQPLLQRLEDRLQLTAALLGQSVAAPPETDIEFGGQRLTPAALQALREKRRASAVDSRWTAGLPPQRAPAPAVFEVVRRGRFEGELGDKLDVLPMLSPGPQRGEIDWFARHVGLAVDGNRLFVSNRFQVDCYELPSGKLQWRTALSRDPARREPPAPAYEYALTPMRPVIAGPQLFVRRLMQAPRLAVRPQTAGQLPNSAPAAVATLACLETATGTVQWSTTNHVTAQLHYVSDPLVIQDQVFAVGQKQVPGGDWVLTLLIHHRADGSLLAERPLAPVRTSFDDQRGCQLTALEDSCLATVGGSVLCFDLAGNLRWARRPFWIPPEADSHWLGQSHEPPLVAGDRCFVVQPGVLNLACLSPESGRLHWQKAMIGLRRLAGLVDGRLIVQTDGGFVCLDPATGTEKWHHDAGHVLSPALCGGPGGLMYATADAIPGSKELHLPALVWVDPETGREKTRLPLDGLRSAQPRLGPLFVAGDRLWAFAGGGSALTRDLIELVPQGHDLPVTPPRIEWDQWLRSVPAPMRAAAAGILPGWTVFASKGHVQMGRVAEFQGQRDVLCAAAPFIVGRHVDVPASGKPRLRLRVASDSKGQCLIVVDVDGKRLGQQEVSGATAGGAWKEWEVDLSAYQGKRLWVVVRHLPRDGETTCSFWSKIELLN